MRLLVLITLIALLPACQHPQEGVYFQSKKSIKFERSQVEEIEVGRNDFVYYDRLKKDVIGFSSKLNLDKKSFNLIKKNRPVDVGIDRGSFCNIYGSCDKLQVMCQENFISGNIKNFDTAYYKIRRMGYPLFSITYQKNENNIDYTIIVSYFRECEFLKSDIDFISKLISG